MQTVDAPSYRGLDSTCSHKEIRPEEYLLLENYYYYRITTGQRYYENEWNAERSPLQTTDLERDSFSLSLHQLPYLCKQWIT